MTKSRYKRKIFNVSNVLGIVIVLVVSFMTLGYSAFQQTGLITDTGATIHAEKNIRVTGVLVRNPQNGAISNYEEYDSTSVSTTLQLPNANSTITYQVEVTNFGNVEMAIQAISGLPSNLIYTINQNEYKLNAMVCDDVDNSQCTLGAQKKINIVISYDTNGYDANNTTYTFPIEFTFAPFNKVAQIGSKYYSSLQAAFDEVPTNGTQTTVTLLQDTSEATSILSTQNVNLNLLNNTLSNNGNTNVIKNYGTLTISNGTITSDASTNGAVNNEQHGTIYITGGRIIKTGGRQALWNDRGTATISGNAYLYSSSTDRASVQNTAGGTMTITGGTIISTGTFALNNLGTLTIGTEGGGMSITSPLIQATTYGAVGVTSTTNFSFFDGVVKSRSTPFDDVSKITAMESGYGIVSSTENIEGIDYNVAHLGISIQVTFDGNGGTPSEPTRYVEENHAIGVLPTASRTGYEFDGWYTAASGGTKIDRTYVITSNGIHRFYAQWTQSPYAAQIGNTKYTTLAAAITAAPNNTQTTIELLKNVSENLTVANTKNIILDLGGKTISNSGSNPIITNSGTLTITNGSLYSNTTQGAINHTAGSLTIDGAEIIATGNRQTIYITGGTATITGDAYLSSATSGKPSGSNMERGTVQVVSGTLIVESGTIVATNQQAISNEGTVIIGTQGGVIDTTSPVLQGRVYGIKTTGTFTFYDGIIKGGTAAVNGTITTWETGTTPTDGPNETIGSITYHTKYLTAN